MPDPIIKKPFEHFNVVTYTGNGTARTISGVGFQPDFVWIKERSSADNHYFYDVVRTATKSLSSNLTEAELTSTNGLNAFTSDGFSLGTDSGHNANGVTYVAWCWKANGTGVSNTVGSITSTVSANTSAGFSVVTYTGTGSNLTFGHGLGVKPAMVIVKPRSFSDNWVVWQQNLPTPTTAYLYLQSTVGVQNFSGYWNSTEPTSTVVSIGANSNTNTNGGLFVAYCFSEVAGYSKFGSFVGNGSTDGAFVSLGFRPAFVMLKASSTGGAGYNWGMFDNDRLGYNSAQRDLRANASDAEGTDDNLIDFLSNGFKIRSTSGGFGGQNGVTYVYMAFAENPFKYSLAR
jgi:hypothetical protein